jgi:tripartite-type tricarboxylate transporter receptor subunit TctC
MSLIDRRQFCLLAAGIGLAPSAVQAQPAYPNRPITLIVGWPAGGASDNVARLVAARMSNALGQQIVVLNQAGAGGNIASGAAARAQADGHTIMLATVASHGWNPYLYPKLNYRPIEDFAPIGLISTSPGTLLVPAGSPHKTVRDLIEAAKANPGKLNYGSAGVGSSQHMAAAMFQKLAGIDMSHIPFRGVAPAISELMAGRLDLIITTGAITFVRSGMLRALAVAARERLPGLSEVSTFEEAGLPGFYTDNWYGLVAPAETPRPILEALNSALNKALADGEVQRQFIEQGAFAAKPTSVDEYWVFVRKQLAEAAELVRASGARLD